MPQPGDSAPDSTTATDGSPDGSKHVITRKVDDLGRVVLPAAIRRTLGIRAGDAIDIAAHDDRIVLRRTVQTCVFCGTDIDLVAFRDRQVCLVCRKSLTQHLD